MIQINDKDESPMFEYAIINKTCVNYISYINKTFRSKINESLLII